jgi:hypothetical protein
MNHEEEVEKAQQEYKLALARIYNKGKGLTFNEGGAGAEARLGAAYQRLVSLGVERQLRGKYRRR